MLNGFGALGRGGCSVPCGLVKLAPSRARARGGQDVAPGAYWSLQQQNVALQTSRQALHAHPPRRAPPSRPPAAPSISHRFLTYCPVAHLRILAWRPFSHPPSVFRSGSPASLTSRRQQTGSAHRSDKPSSLASPVGFRWAPECICRHRSRERGHPAPPFPPHALLFRPPVSCACCRVPTATCCIPPLPALARAPPLSAGGP